VLHALSVEVPPFYRGVHRSGRIIAGRIFTGPALTSIKWSATLLENCQMAKNKQQKKKERERRVAQKKLATAAKKRAQEKTTKESQKPAPKRTKLMTAAVPKTDFVATNKKSSFTQRRSGG
jgi:hypothetical protein